MAKLNFQYGFISDCGDFKEVNQDKILIKIGEDQTGEFGIFAIADGMGGFLNGEVASEIVMYKLSKWWEVELTDIIFRNKDIFKQVSHSLNKVVNKINDEIINYSNEINGRVGTTLSLIFIYDSEYIIKHIGDSRIYVLNNNIRKLTEDHTLVEQQIKAGIISESQARNHDQSHILTRCLGVDEEIKIFEQRGHVKYEDIFLLCSDGLYKTLYDKEMYSSIKEGNHSLQKKMEMLLKTARVRGEEDNISAICLFVHDDKNRFMDGIKKFLKL